MPLLSSCDGNAGAAGCQTSATSSQQVVIGVTSTQVISVVNNVGYEIAFGGGKDSRAMVVQLVCDPTQSGDIIWAENHGSPGLTFYIKGSTSMACPGGKPPGCTAVGESFDLTPLSNPGGYFVSLGAALVNFNLCTGLRNSCNGVENVAGCLLQNAGTKQTVIGLHQSQEIARQGNIYVFNYTGSDSALLARIHCAPGSPGPIASWKASNLGSTFILEGQSSHACH